jgi:succinate dehydrogenase / fumarate reductase flavoprotein subunit
VFRAQYADTEEEADRWYKDPDNNRARRSCCPGRGGPGDQLRGQGRPRLPHGGVFLDVSTRLPAEEIIKRLPSMHHQFKELADVDITAEPMEVGPTCHYVMGGVEVDPTPRGRRCRAVRGRRGVRRHARLEPARRQLAVRPAGLRPPAGTAAADYVDALGEAARSTDADVGGGATRAGAVRAARRPAENPYTVHASCSSR